MNQKVQSDFSKDWMEEVIDSNEKRLYKVARRIYADKSQYQTIEVIELVNQGVTLFLDGSARVFEVDEYLYHEALIHPALHLHQNPQNILLIGDGDAGGIRELLKYKCINNIDWVEIDELVVRICEAYLPSFPQGIFNEERLHTFWMDGFKFLEDSDIAKYDCIFISVTEQSDGNVSQPFYTQPVLELVKRLLRPNGYCIQSAGVTSPGLTSKFKEVYNKHQKVFTNTNFYSVGIPSFGLSWGYCLSSQYPLSNWSPQISQDSLRYYDKYSHQIMFMVPSYLNKDLGL